MSETKKTILLVFFNLFCQKQATIIYVVCTKTAEKLRVIKIKNEQKGGLTKLKYMNS
jgi:hypothetical protein